MSVLCPLCSADLPEDDRFCEECGTPLCDCCPKCAAGPGEIDEDGFCLACGIRRVAPARDHLEIAISPELAAVSDRGQRHHRNEDFVALQPGIVVVCDGVSSTPDADKGAEVAAGTALRAIARGAALEDAVAEAQTAVAALTGESESPATTIVAAAIGGRGVRIAWLGDSRAYWIGPNDAKQLTQDHSWVHEAVAAGELTAEEANGSKNAHAITRWLGADAPENASPSVAEFEAPGPGFLLLCTDGLWNYAPDTEALANLARSSGSDAVAIARSLVSFANRSGGHDNITAAVFIWPEQSL